MVKTVRDNMKGYTKREIREAQLARRAYKMMNRPSLKDFLKMIDLITDCPVSVEDTINAEKYWKGHWINHGEES